MKISELGERALIKQISALVQKTAEPGMLGIGDDAALTRAREGAWLVTTKDMLVEGVHFLLPAVSPYDLGYKALAVNVSDVAAMGGSPRHVYVALALPKSTEVGFVLDFYRGLLNVAERFGISVSGGDTVGSPGPLVVSITVQGEVNSERALLRSGGSPGDILCSTGPLGASAAGLLLLLRDSHNKNNLPSELYQAALDAHLRPSPRVAEGLFFAESGAVTAAMDLSDGLLKDLGEICDASGCGACLDGQAVPVHPAAAAVALLHKRDALDLALNGGEDYELLLAVKPVMFPSLAETYFSRFGTPLYRFGELVREKGLSLVTKEGKREKLSFTGFKHF